MKNKALSNNANQKALNTIREMGGTVRTTEAVQYGVHPRTLYQLRDSGDLQTLSRGVYRLSELDEPSEPDLVIIAKRIPRAVICLVSALAYHELTTQVPHTISIALPKGAETPRVTHPPIAVHRFSEEALNQGIETHQIDGVAVHVYCPEKTLADCFKFRNKLGMDIVLEGLKLYRSRKTVNVEQLMAYGRVCRVEKIMRPYLEAII